MPTGRDALAFFGFPLLKTGRRVQSAANKSSQELLAFQYGQPMSIRIMSQVWLDHSIIDKTDLLVLLVIADHANDEGVAWPSIRTIAAKTRSGERTVQRSINHLVASGRLEIAEEGGGRRSNRYTVMLEPPQGCHHDTGVTMTPVTQLCHPTPVIAMTPEPLYNHQNIKKETTSEQGTLPLTQEPPPQPKRFKRPVAQELNFYSQKIGLPPEEVERFVDYYESIGWKSGRTPIVDWQARMRTWKKNWEDRRQSASHGQRVQVSRWGQPIPQKTIAEKEIEAMARAL